LADIDLDTHKEIQTEFNINGFPTLILFHNGKQIKFGGARNLEFMLFWLTKRTKQPLIPITPEELPSLESDGYVNIVFRGDLNSPKAAILSKLSETDDYNSKLSSYLSVLSSQGLHQH
jgi:thioredoxin-like negative regulator of GroEL